MGYIYYCPRCGQLITSYAYHHELSYDKKCNCKSFLSEKFLQSQIKYEDFQKSAYEPVAKGAEYTEFTQPMWDTIWDQYVNISANKRLSKNAFLKTQARVQSQLAASSSEQDFKKQKRNAVINALNNGQSIERFKPSYSHIMNTTTIVSCPKCGSKSISTVKQGFGVGKAVAGVIAAGPEGALAGAVGANKILNVCQNCGHQWEPGK